MRLARFAAAQSASLLVVPIGAIAVLAAHLGAHAVAVAVNGGSVVGIDWSPGPDVFVWGSLIFETLPPNRIASVAAAPVPVLAAWIGLASIVSALSGSERVARTAWWLGFVVPMLDLSLGAGGLFLHQPRADWSRAFLGREVEVALACGLAAAWFGEIGERMFRRGFGHAISPSEFVAMYLGLLMVPWLRYLA